MKCIFCHNTTARKISNHVRDSRAHSIVRCNSCKLVQLTPLPSLYEMEEFYNDCLQFTNIKESTHYNELKKNQHDDTVRRANTVSTIIPIKSELLDIGSGFGFFIKEMKKRKYKMTGIEISSFARNISKKKSGCDVLNINLLTQSLSRRFDGITLFHVLEHISEPLNFLRNLKNNLRKNSPLIIEVPNLSDHLLKINSEYKQFYWQKAHLSYFNSNTLTQLLQKAGYVVDSIIYYQRYGLDNFIYWNALNKPQITSPSFSSTSKYKWLEKYYKQYLVQSKQSDTIISISHV